jgi:hypothetical protein
MGIRLKIAMKEDLPRDFELIEELGENKSPTKTDGQDNSSVDEAISKTNQNSPTRPSIDRVESTPSTVSVAVENKNETDSNRSPENVNSPSAEETIPEA